MTTSHSAAIEFRSGDVVFGLGPLVCPRCRRQMYHVDGYGILRLFCNSNTCRAPWLAIRLPYGATAKDVTGLYGIVVSRGLISSMAPDTEQMADEMFNTIRIVWTETPLYIQKSMSNIEAHRSLPTHLRQGAARILVGGAFFV